MQPKPKRYSIQIYLALSLLLFAACNRSDSPDKTKSDPPPVTIQLPTDTVFPAAFEYAFLDGYSKKEDSLFFRFRQESPGSLHIETGKLFVCGESVLPVWAPLTEELPKGKYPLELALAQTPEYDLVAMARLRFSDYPVRSWEPARLAGDSILALRDSLFNCFPTEVGQAVLMDSILVRQVSSDQQLYDKIFFEEPDQRNYRPFLYDLNGLNLAVIPSGYGDGCYGVYVGRDEDSAICRLLIDFDVIGW